MEEDWVTIIEFSLKCLFGHQWSGCKCKRCGKTRDEQHNWDGYSGKCKRCGKTQKEQLSIEVVEKITDETFLKEIVMKHWSNFVREVAIKKISDMEFLKEVALNDVYEGNRRLAIEQITNDVYLKEIIIKSLDREVRIRALAKITDVRCLKEVDLSGLFEEAHKGERDCIHEVKNWSMKEKTPKCYVFGCYDYDRVVAMSLFQSGFYSPDNVIKMVRKWQNVPISTEVKYIEPKDWNAPYIEATSNGFACNIADLYSQAARFLVKTAGFDTAKLCSFSRTNIPYPEQGLLLIVYKPS